MKMTKQEEIREETRNILERYGNFMDGNCMADDDLDIDEALEAIFSYLHSQGVVIKGENALCSICGKQHKNKLSNVCDCGISLADRIKPVEPLI